ncbi:MAG TPA: hypothetical protein DHU16_06005, partial [Gammaproteobacteria bacterium]|nr:hypothetical protein [Gammaproteobacteria bacterium]
MAVRKRRFCASARKAQGTLGVRGFTLIEML